MLRRVVLIIVALVSATLAFLVAQDPGHVRIVVRGLEIEMAAAVLAALVIFLALFGAFIIWLVGAPRRMTFAGVRRKREKGIEALEEALVAIASGDGRSARKEARRAEGLLERGIASRLIAAQAAEQMGDVVGAESQYAAMLAEPRTELVGRRGLAAAALSRRDFETAIVHAKEAFAANPGARWAFDLLFDAQVRASKWEDAAETLEQGVRRNHIPDAAARRRKAVLMAATADSIEREDPHRARALAEQSASLSPAFAPGAALAARLLLAHGKNWRAAGLLEDAWVAGPHPALALAYRDLKTGEAPAARAKRMRGLAEMNPEHRESRILAAEQALVLGDGTAAAAALQPLVEEEKDVSARLCGLMAQVAQAGGDVKTARGWLARAALAPGEPDWSDLDPEGPAFAYTDADWARLVYSYGDTGALIHPRHERFERQRLTADHTLLLEGPQEAEEGVESAADAPEAAAPKAAKRPKREAPAPALISGQRAPDDPGVEE